jgi:hypothetical protein
MATKSEPTNPVPAKPADHSEPVNSVEPVEPVRKAPQPRYVFAKGCTNDFGRFEKGDRARGAFPPDLIVAYLKAGVLVEVARG